MPILYGYPEPKFYRLHKFALQLHKDKDLREKFRQKSDEVMEQFNLSEEEKELIKSKDPVKMFNAGISPYAIFYIVWEGYGLITRPVEEQMLYYKIQKKQ